MPQVTEHVFEEKKRVEKLSRIRELVFGSQDGLLVPLGVVSSVAGAFSNNHIVIIAGLSEALAGAFSMATGAYLSSQAEKQVYDAEIKKETQEIINDPEHEKKEMVEIYQKDGMPTFDAQKIADLMSKHQKSFIKTMIHLELGVDPNPAGTPIGDALMALFAIGLLKAKFALLPYLRSGLQVLLIGAAAGFGGYFLGTLLPKVLGIS